MLNLNIPSPIQYLKTFANKTELYIKREDLIHVDFGGNKYRKLKYNINYFLQNNYENLVTFGGAFSNHIAAVASIGKFYNIPTIGIIRGTFNDPNNPTLNLAKTNGMEIIHVPKLDYQLKDKSELIHSIIKKYPKAFLVPEGGSNTLAKKGVMEAGFEIESQGQYEHLVVAAGTGMTASGLIDSVNKNTKIWIVNVLNNSGLKTTIESQITNTETQWEILDNYTFGGYAKVPVELVEFANSFFLKYKIKLDPIYTAKTMYAVLDLISNNIINGNSKVLAVHSGGLQGIKGYEYVSKKTWVNHKLNNQ